MKWEIFKKNMQSNLNQHSSEVDIDQIWGNIEGEVDALNQESQKKRLALLLFLLLGVGLAGGFVLWSNTTYENRIAAESSVKEATIQTKKSNQQTDFNPTIQNNDVSISASEIEKVAVETKSDLVVNQVEETKVDNSTLKFQKANKKQANRKENKEKRKFNSSKNQNLIAVSNQNNQQLNSYNSDKPTNIPAQLHRDGNKTEFVSEEEKAKKAFNDLIALAPAGGIMLEYNSVIPKEKGELIYTGWSNLGFIDGLNLKSKKKGFSFYLDVNGGYSIPKQSLSAKGETETEYLQFRRESEKLVAASQFGANFIARHSSGFEILTGIRRTSVIQRFQYTYSYIFTEHINQVSTVGEEIVVRPQLEITYRTFVDKKYYSKHNYLEIPLMVGYHLDAGKFNFGIQSGVYASLLLKTNGTISDITGEQTIDIANDLDERYTSKFGIGYAFGLSFGYDLHERLAINFSPTVQYNPTDYSAASHSVAQKQLLFGGNVGLNIQLSR